MYVLTLNDDGQTLYLEDGGEGWVSDLDDAQILFQKSQAVKLKRQWDPETSSPSNWNQKTKIHKLTVNQEAELVLGLRNDLESAESKLYRVRTDVLNALRGEGK